MNHQSILGCIAAILTIIQYSYYIKEVVNRNTHPHAFSWFIWGFPCAIVFLAQFYDGGGAGTWTTALTTFFCTIIFFLSLFYGEKTITKLDWASLFIALLSIAFWVVIRDPLFSVTLITFIDVIGFIPTLRKSLNKPHQETLFAYWLGGLKWTMSILAMSHYSLIILLYPMTMLTANWGFGGMIFMRRFSLAVNQRRI